MGRFFWSISALILLIFELNVSTEAGVVGVNYGLLGNNLPPPSQAVGLLKSRGINRVRLFEPNHDVLQALQNTGIRVVLGTLNQDLQRLGNDLSFAKSWVNSNVIPYANTTHFRYIAAGNEVIPGPLAAFVLPAMKNLKAALNAVGLVHLPVSTAVATSVLGQSYPPSQGEFSKDVVDTMRPIAAFLAANRSPLLVNVYPYFAYIYNLQQISLSYALFGDTVAVVDGNLQYRNLFDAIVDAVHSALEKVGAGSVRIVVSESGWPSNENGDIATIAKAQKYVSSLIAHVSSKSGTPKRPKRNIETYIFSLFNENLKPAGTEQNFGLYYPNKTEVFHVDFPR